jgi:hypothetical protein
VAVAAHGLRRGRRTASSAHGNTEMTAPRTASGFPVLYVMLTDFIGGHRFKKHVGGGRYWNSDKGNSLEMHVEITPRRRRPVFNREERDALPNLRPISLVRWLASVGKCA